MVFSIEPALRVPEEKIYIRLEDMLAETANGVEVLSGFVPADMEGIERVMREPGMLQRYPRAGADQVP
jgi:Xaa-Pro aminopeptidase